MDGGTVAGRRKWINPPPCNWINRRFVARPASHLLFTECAATPRALPPPPPPR